MIKPFEFYFDFASPYSYIAHKEIVKIEKRFQIKIIYMPIFLSGLHKFLGITGPTLIPSKAKFMIRDCKLLAEKYKINFRFNSYFPINSLNLMRGVLIAEKDNFASLYIDKIFDATWRDGLNLNDNSIIEKVLKNLNLNPKNFLIQITNQKIKEELINRTNDACDKGIFGTPSFFVNNKMFWGQDRLEFVLAEAKK